MTMDQKLKSIFEETLYIVDDDPPLVLRIGQRNDGMRILLASFNVDSAAYITAWNPGGSRLTLDDNYDRQAELLAAIETRRLNYFVGTGEHPTGDWSEESYLVLGISRDDADDLATQFDQQAYVWIPPSGVPELAWLSRHGEQTT
mgnify:FL=1|jgi:hypothetical protein